MPREILAPYGAGEKCRRARLRRARGQSYGFEALVLVGAGVGAADGVVIGLTGVVVGLTVSVAAARCSTIGRFAAL